MYIKSVAGLNENTLRREIGLARQFFNAAIDAKLITRNPFRSQPVKISANQAKFYYVAQDIAEKVPEICPDAQWRLIFGLGHAMGGYVIQVRFYDLNDRMWTSSMIALLSMPARLRTILTAESGRFRYFRS